MTSSVLFLGLAVGLAAYGCGSPAKTGNVFAGGGGTPASAGTTGTAGTPATGGTTGTAGTPATGGTTGTAGTPATGGTTGTAGTPATGGTTGTAGTPATGGTTGGGGTPGTGGVTGAGGGGPLGDITKVLPTAGCGLDPGQTAGMTVRYTINTTGTKDANCADHTAQCAPGPTCGPTAWTYTREYFITLPVGYDKTKAYPLVLEGPGCGSNGQAVYPLSYMGQNNANNTVIRVGLTPPPNAIGHATNSCQGCFDDKEGDDSVDWIFYEDLYDHLSTTICFDRNRVFSLGNSSGAWFSNELGCKYAGDPKRPVRGIMPNTGGLPSQAMYEPTCTSAPMSGMWVGETMDPENSFTNNEFAITRAMGVNHCTQTTFATAVYANFPIGGGIADTVCKQIQNCPALYPLVVCLIPGNQHAGHDNITNPGFSTYLSLFGKAPLLTP